MKRQKLPKDVATARTTMICVGNPIRWKIIELLQKHQKLKPSDLEQMLSLGQAAVGGHLKDLWNNGIVEKLDKQQHNVYYYLLPKIKNVQSGIKQLSRA